MGDFGKFGTFSNPSGVTEARTEPTVLETGTDVRGKPELESGVKKKLADVSPKTYEQRTRQIKYGNLVLGSLYRMSYRRWQHDPTPLALILSSPRPDIGCVRAINLHYISPKAQMNVILRAMYINGGHIKQGKPLILEYELLKPMLVQTAKYVPFRLYKIQHVADARYIPVSRWVQEVKRTRTILPG